MEYAYYVIQLHDVKYKTKERTRLNRVITVIKDGTVTKGRGNPFKNVKGIGKTGGIGLMEVGKTMVRIKKNWYLDIDETVKKFLATN